MGRLTTLLAWIVVLALIGFGAWAVVRGVEAEPSVVGTFATAAAAIIAVAVSRNWEKRRELEQSHRAQLAPLYEQLYIEFNRTVEDGEEDPSRTEFFHEVQRKMLLFGPTPVVKAWLRWQRATDELPEEETDPDATRLLLWEELMFAIREDLGHKNDGLAAGDLLRLSINDSDAAVAVTLATNPEAKKRFTR